MIRKIIADKEKMKSNFLKKLKKRNGETDKKEVLKR